MKQERNKTNLLKLLVDSRRVKELDRLIPLEIKKIEGIRVIDANYQMVRNRLDEYLLEYQERTGREYGVFVGEVKVQIISNTILDVYSHGVSYPVPHDNTYQKSNKPCS